MLRLTILLCQDHPLLIVLGAELAKRAEPSMSVDLLHDTLDNISKRILEIFLGEQWERLLSKPHLKKETFSCFSCKTFIVLNCN